MTHGTAAVEGPSASPGLDQNISGELEQHFAEARAKLEEVVMSKVLAPQGYGLDPSHWSELTPMPPWGHHNEVAVPFHHDLDEAQVGRAAQRWPNPFADAATPDAPAITDGWIEQKIALFHDAAHDLVENEAEARFRTLEQRLDLLSAQLLDEQKREVDVMVDGSPAGWRRANAMLNQAQEHIERHIHTVQDELEAIEFSDLEADHLEPLRDETRKKMQSLFDSLDKKPIYQRAAWLAVKLGLVWGVAFGALATILLPWSVGNLAITMVPAVALGVFFAWRQIKSDNRRRLDDVNAFLGRDTEDEEPGHFFRLFDQARREVFRTAYPQGQRGDKKYWLACRVEWSCLLWQLRFWKRLRRTLRVDIERLTEVGQAIEHGERRTRGDQMDLKVRFHESKNRWFEDSSRLFGDSSQFRHLLTDPQVAESFYADYAVDPHRAAEHFINETQPLDGWRDGPPMTERRPLKDFITKYFKPVEDIDFFQDQRSRPRALEQLKTFMHEYAFKLDLLTDEGMNYDARVASGDTVLVTHPRNLEVLREVSPAEHWPGPWDILEHPVDPNFVAILHHRQGLAPWELPILGGTIEQLEALTYLGAQPVVLKLIKSIPNPSKRCLAAAFALQKLVYSNRPEFEPGVSRTDRDDEGSSWRLGEDQRAFGSDVISAAFSRLAGNFAPTDTEHICPAEDAPQWMRHFVENHQLVDLAVQLYGYQPNESSLVTSSPTRVRLEAIMSACGDMHSLSGKRSACRALLKLPKKHRDSDLFGLLYADMVWDKIQQIPYGVPGVSPDEVERDYERVLRDIGLVRPWSLRSATILKNSLRLVDRDQIEEAKQMIYLDRIPDSERAPLPGFNLPSVDRLERFVEALAPEFERENAEHLVTNILNCFGDQTDGDVHRIDELRIILERAHPRRRTGLRKLVARYGAGSLPHRLVDALLGSPV